MAVINGTAGNDVITGTTANDEIHGGAGNDRINGGAGDDVIYGGEGNDTLTGDAGNDTLYGGNGNDGFFGGGGNDTIYGEAGDDVMYGDAGDDTLYGGEGNDQLFGGAGNDILYGGSGTNILNGGAGTDTFVLEFESATLTAAMRTDLATLKQWFTDQAASAGSASALAAQTSGPSLTLSALGVTISNIENVKIFLDGVEKSLDSFLNVAPTAAANVSITTDEDTPFSGHIAASDADGDALSYAVQNAPSHGSLTLNAATGAYVYTPSANYHGADSFKVTVTDPSGLSVVQTVAVGVTSVNDAPTAAANLSLVTDEDTVVAGHVTATDVDGDTLAYAVQQGPSNGTLTLNAATGAYVYTPSANYHGADSFQVTVTDPSGAAVVQTISIGVTAVNDAPTAAANVALSTNEDTPVSGQIVASDVDGDVLAYGVQQGPANGTLTLNAATGAFVYTPAANYHGADSFQVTVTDPSGAQAVQTVSVGVASVNDAPTAAANVSITTDEDTAVSGQVVATDIDGDTLGYALAEGPRAGTLTLDASTGQYVYTPGANFNGTDSFRVAIADPSGAAVVQTVTVGVAPVNDAVTIAQAAVSFTTQEDKSVSGQVIASDVDGDTLTWSIDTAPSHGTVALDAATGKYTYTPAAHYAGSDVFHVAVTDPSGTRALQRVELSISPVADQPTLAVVNPIVVPETTPGSLGLIGDLLGTILGTKGDDTIDAGIWAHVTVALEIDAALVDRDGSETLSIRIKDVPANGVLSAGVKNADGSWSVSPDELQGLTLTAETRSNFSVKVEATATESNGTTATTTATVNVVMKSDGVTINGGGGNDTITGSIGNDKLYGGNGNDTIYGGEGADKIEGGKGNDFLHGGAGNDYLNGNSGDDTFFWDTGNDVYAGGSGYDTLSYAGASSGINADLSKKTIYGAASGTDSIYGSAMEKIIGTSFADTFKGSSGVDTIDGGAGNDWIRGLGGADILTGGAGNDTFFWEKTDVGSGMGVDRIKDFSVGDRLDFSKLVSLGSKSLADMVKVQDTTQGLIVSAKIGSAFVQVASLDDVHGKTAAQLFADGQLLVG